MKKYMRVIACCGLWATFAPLNLSAEEWVYFESTDPFDDTKTFYAMLDASAEVTFSMDHTPQRIVVRCSNVTPARKGDDFEAYVNTSGYIGSEGDGSVRYKFEPSGRVKRGQWSLSRDGDSVFAPDPYGFARGIIDNTRLVFEVTDFRGVSEYNTFEWAAFSVQKVRDVMEACGVNR